MVTRKMNVETGSRVVNFEDATREVRLTFIRRHLPALTLVQYLPSRATLCCSTHYQSDPIASVLGMTKSLVIEASLIRTRFNGDNRHIRHRGCLLASQDATCYLPLSPQMPAHHDERGKVPRDRTGWAEASALRWRDAGSYIVVGNRTAIREPFVSYRGTICENITISDCGAGNELGSGLESGRSHRGGVKSAS